MSVTDTDRRTIAETMHRERRLRAASPDERRERELTTGVLANTVIGARLGFVELLPGTEEYQDTAQMIRALWDFPLSVFWEEFLAGAADDVPGLQDGEGAREHVEALIERVMIYALTDAAVQIAHANCRAHGIA